MLSPKRTRFRKQHRGRMKGISWRGNQISFDRYALQALELAWITARQIRSRAKSNDMICTIIYRLTVYPILFMKKRSK